MPATCSCRYGEATCQSPLSVLRPDPSLVIRPIAVPLWTGTGTGASEKTVGQSDNVAARGGGEGGLGPTCTRPSHRLVRGLPLGCPGRTGFPALPCLTPVRHQSETSCHFSRCSSSSRPALLLDPVNGPISPFLPSLSAFSRLRSLSSAPSLLAPSSCGRARTASWTYASPADALPPWLQRQLMNMQAVSASFRDATRRASLSSYINNIDKLVDAMGHALHEKHV